MSSILLYFFKAQVSIISSEDIALVSLSSLSTSLDRLHSHWSSHPGDANIQWLSAEVWKQDDLRRWISHVCD